MIEYILNNPVYKGYTRWTPTGRTGKNFDNPKSIIAKGKHEAIISEEIFQEVHEKYKIHKMHQKPNGRPYTEYRHWLSGLVYCSECGAGLSYSTSRYPFFKCSGYNRGKCTISSYITVINLEKVVIEELRNTIINLSNKDYNIKIIYTKTNKTEVDNLQKQLNIINNKQERAAEAFLAGIDTIEEYKKIKIF